MVKELQTIPAGSNKIIVTVGRNSPQQYPRGITPAEILQRIRHPKPEAILAAKVNGRVVDLNRPLAADSTVEFLTFDEAEGREVFWHSSAHVMAQAVTELFPGTKLAIGPPIEEGFYYDFDRGEPFSPEDLEQIEKRMRKIVAGAYPFQRTECSREEALERFGPLGEKYKLEILEAIPPDEQVSLYTHATFTDLCRGPHLPDTGGIKAVKLTASSGAYWRGSEKNPMLQRIYGVSYPDPALLDDFLRRMEEAKRRDHRRLGKELKLFTFAEEVGRGLPLWLPKGATVRRILERYIVDLEQKKGYQHVYTPPLANVELYKISGHWDHFRENMYPPLVIEEEELVLRPMNCPHHIMIYKSEPRSYRDLPVRLAELGEMFRYERSGVLTGLHRVRGMVLNDAHIFCAPEQIKKEFQNVVRLILEVYQDLQITDFWHRLSLHDPQDRVKYAQNEEMWRVAEGMLREALDELGLPYVVAPGEANFYGPKLDVQIKTATGQEETLSTVQLDFHLPERFGLEYAGADGQPHRPVMIHRAIISTLERMTAFLIERYVGAFPLWLAPVQVAVLPITDAQVDYARFIHERLVGEGFRAVLDLGNEKIGYKIREAEVQKVPYMFIVGKKETEAGTVALRRHGQGDLGAKVLESAIAVLQAEVETKAVGPPGEKLEVSKRRETP